MLHKQAFTLKFLHREVFTQSKFLHRETFASSKFLRRGTATRDAQKLRNICCQSTVRNIYAATTIRFTTPSYKTLLQGAALARPFHSDLHRLTIDLHHKIELQHTTVERVALTCAVSSAKSVSTHAKHSSSKIPCKGDEARDSIAHPSQRFSVTEAPSTRKTMLRANPTFKSP